MRRMPAGQWLPFEGYDKVHVCGSAAPINTQLPRDEVNVAPGRVNRISSAGGYDDLEFVDFNLQGQPITEGSQTTQKLTGRRARRKQVTAQASPTGASDLGGQPGSMVSATRTAVVPSFTSKRNVLLVILFAILGVTAAYLILIRQAANKNAPTPKSSSPPREYTSTQNNSFDQPKSLTAVEYYEQGLSMTKARKYEEAAESYRQAINQDPGMAEAHHELGYAYTQMRQWDKAVTSLNQAIALRPAFADSHRLLGDALSRLSRWKEAAESYSQAIAVQPDSVAAYLGLGAVYRQLEQPKEAVAAYLKVVKLKPNNASAHYELGLLYLRLRDLDSAQAEYDLLLPLNAKLAERLQQAISEY